MNHHITGLIVISLSFLLQSSAIGQALHFDPIADVAVGGHPESVIGDSNFLYASNLGAGTNFFQKDGNGYISKISYDGQLLEKKHLSLAGQLDAPTGMAILGNRLFVADIDEVIGFDLTGAMSPTRIDLSPYGVSFLNDLVAVSDSELIVSGTNVKKLFLIDTESQSSKEILVNFNLNHPNGLEFDSTNNQLLVAANISHTIGSILNGEILKLDIDLAGNSLALADRVQSAGRFLDGISLFGENQLIFSDWVSNGGFDGTLGRLNIFSNSLATPTELNLRGFADFHWQQNRRILAAPDLIGGNIKLLHHPIPEPSTFVLVILTYLSLQLYSMARKSAAIAASE